MLFSPIQCKHVSCLFSYLHKTSYTGSKHTACLDRSSCSAPPRLKRGHILWLHVVKNSNKTCQRTCMNDGVENKRNTTISVSSTWIYIPTNHKSELKSLPSTASIDLAYH